MSKHHGGCTCTTRRIIRLRRRSPPFRISHLQWCENSLDFPILIGIKRKYELWIRVLHAKSARFKLRHILNVWRHSTSTLRWKEINYGGDYLLALENRSFLHFNKHTYASDFQINHFPDEKLKSIAAVNIWQPNEKRIFAFSLPKYHGLFINSSFSGISLYYWVCRE